MSDFRPPAFLDRLAPEDRARLARLPWPFLLVVLLPTLLATIYFLLIASPRYVSEARFIVRAPSQAQPTALGLTLQGVGLAPAQTDAFAVHDYVRSRDGLRALMARQDVRRVLGPAGADLFSRYPRPGESRSFEDLHKAFGRYVAIGYDATTGISTLRVETFRPRDSQAMAELLLQGGEALVNRLNERAEADAVGQGQRSLDEAQDRLGVVQQRLTRFRTRERFLDPQRQAQESTQLIGALLAQVAALRAERAQIAAEAPISPQLPSLDARIAAFERQIAAERAKVAGGQGSLAPRVTAYEDLVRERETAERQVAEAEARLVEAREDARRQNRYLERIVQPNLPDEATRPRRWLSVLIVFLSALLLYGVGWLIVSGVREHRQD